MVSQAPGECNFHVFHLLLAGASDELLKELCLERDPKAFSYTKQVIVTLLYARQPSRQWDGCGHNFGGVGTKYRLGRECVRRVCMTRILLCTPIPLCTRSKLYPHPTTPYIVNPGLVDVIHRDGP